MGHLGDVLGLAHSGAEIGGNFRRTAALLSRIEIRVGVGYADWQGAGVSNFGGWGSAKVSAIRVNSQAGGTSSSRRFSIKKRRSRSAACMPCLMASC